MTKAEILKQWYKEVWEDGKLDVIEDYFVSEPHNQYIVPNFGIEPAEIREWVSVLRSFVTDIKVTIVHSIEEGDWLSAMLEIRCLNALSGQPVKVYQQIMLRFDGPLKAESYPSFDFIRFFEQLGQLPENTHALLLGGTKLE
ncbi:ester cyclase [uncultured Roseobacter sp.]|uniref:ester cyclase n=1 Tax=uncultured Roseobacter sp. TaxID=114847 RepID=UPI002629E5F0|nr:ester cyclase [uncultured Roseobacter sp.]